LILLGNAFRQRLHIDLGLQHLNQCGLDTVYQGKIQDSNKVDPVKISNKWICIEKFQQLIVLVDMDVECNFFQWI
jgi:hypothetical protein